MTEIERQLQIKYWVEYLKQLEKERLNAVKQIRMLNNGH